MWNKRRRHSTSLPQKDASPFCRNQGCSATSGVGLLVKKSLTFSACAVAIRIIGLRGKGSSAVWLHTAAECVLNRPGTAKGTGRGALCCHMKGAGNCLTLGEGSLLMFKLKFYSCVPFPPPLWNGCSWPRGVIFNSFHRAEYLPSYFPRAPRTDQSAAPLGNLAPNAPKGRFGCPKSEAQRAFS